MADRLPSELLCIIGCKLECTGDRIRFRAVSKSWRSSLPFRQPPWLMLSQSEEDEVTLPSEEAALLSAEERVTQDLRLRRLQRQRPPPPRGFVSLGDQAIYKIDFPEIHQARVVGSTGNWLITIHYDNTLRLSNPFSKLQFHLPSQLVAVSSTGSEEISHLKLFKVVSSSSQPNSSNTCWAAILLHNRDKVLAITRPGEASWGLCELPAQFVDSSNKSHGIDDAIFYKQHIYAITYKGRLMVCDAGDGRKPPQVWYISNGFSCFSDTIPGQPKHYLVEWRGELLMVVRDIVYSSDGSHRTSDGSHRTNAFKIYKFDFENREFDRLRSLGGHSLFLGYNTSLSVLASDYFGLVRSNCIYFTDDYMYDLFGDKGGHDMGVFDLEDNSITPHFEDTSTTRYSPPVWIIPA